MVRVVVDEVDLWHWDSRMAVYICHGRQCTLGLFQKLNFRISSETADTIPAVLEVKDAGFMERSALQSGDVHTRTVCAREK